MVRTKVTIIDGTSNRDGATFIERYGYVQYRNRLPYPRGESCEVLGCGIHKTFGDMLYRATDQEWYLRWKQEQAYDPFYGVLGAPEYADEYTDDEIRSYLEIGLRREQRNQERAGKSGLVFDHCHEHGWIRGIICASCNGKMRDVDLRMEYTQVHILCSHGDSVIEIELPTPAYNRHWEKCPDCFNAGPWTALLGGIPKRIDA